MSDGATELVGRVEMVIVTLLDGNTFGLVDGDSLRGVLGNKNVDVLIGRSCDGDVGAFLFSIFVCVGLVAGRSGCCCLDRRGHVGNLGVEHANNLITFAAISVGISLSSVSGLGSRLRGHGQTRVLSLQLSDDVVESLDQVGVATFFSGALGLSEELNLLHLLRFLSQENGLRELGGLQSKHRVTGESHQILSFLYFY
jgi:hypothetical protein